MILGRRPHAMLQRKPYPHSPCQSVLREKILPDPKSHDWFNPQLRPERFLSGVLKYLVPHSKFPPLSDGQCPFQRKVERKKRNRMVPQWIHTSKLSPIQ